MLCVICLRNNADFRAVCGSCLELNLPNHNKILDVTISKKLMELSSESQIRIIKLTHRRFQSLLEYDLSREFNLSLVLKEYIEMDSRNDDLEMLVTSREEREYSRMSYHQYVPPKRED